MFLVLEDAAGNNHTFPNEIASRCVEIGGTIDQGDCSVKWKEAKLDATRSRDEKSNRMRTLRTPLHHELVPNSGERSSIGLRKACSPHFTDDWPVYSSSRSTSGEERSINF